MNESCPHRKNVFLAGVGRAYTLDSVTTKRNLVRWAAGAMLVLGTAGCGGINASRSVSPLDFILPGLIKTTPSPAEPSGTATNSVRLVAQVR
jgi:hypothetical protein